MNLNYKTRGLIAQVVLSLAFCLGAGPAHATVIVNLDVTPSGGNYHYEISINNQEAEDLALVNLNDTPFDPLIVSSLTAPTGFQAIYDSGVLIISFLEESNRFFAGTTTSGFGFESVYAPAGFFSGAEGLGAFSGTLYDGQVNVNQMAVPDGINTLLAVALGLSLMAFGRKQWSACSS